MSDTRIALYYLDGLPMYTYPPISEGLPLAHPHAQTRHPGFDGEDVRGQEKQRRQKVFYDRHHSLFLVYTSLPILQPLSRTTLPPPPPKKNNNKQLSCQGVSHGAFVSTKAVHSNRVCHIDTTGGFGGAQPLAGQ